MGKFLCNFSQILITCFTYKKILRLLILLLLFVMGFTTVVYGGTITDLTYKWYYDYEVDNMLPPESFDLQYLDTITYDLDAHDYSYDTPVNLIMQHDPEMSTSEYYFYRPVENIFPLTHNCVSATFIASLNGNEFDYRIGALDEHDYQYLDFDCSTYNTTINFSLYGFSRISMGISWEEEEDQIWDDDQTASTEYPPVTFFVYEVDDNEQIHDEYYHDVTKVWFTEDKSIFEGKSPIYSCTILPDEGYCFIPYIGFTAIAGIGDGNSRYDTFLSDRNVYAVTVDTSNIIITDIYTEPPISLPITAWFIPESLMFSESYYELTAKVSPTYKLLNSERIDVPVVKIWEDDNDRDRYRPQDICITLTATAGAVSQEVWNHTLNINNADSIDNNNWRYTFENLRKFYESNPITYTISETPGECLSQIIKTEDNCKLSGGKWENEGCTPFQQTDQDTQQDDTSGEYNDQTSCEAAGYEWIPAGCGPNIDVRDCGPADDWYEAYCLVDLFL